MENTWFTCPSYPKYQVNLKGEIRSVKTKKLRKPVVYNGYKAISVYEGQYDENDNYGKKKIMITIAYVARLVYEATHPLATLGGKIPKGNVGRGMIWAYDPDDCEVDHIDRDKGNKSPFNLRYVSKSENMVNKACNGLRGIKVVQTKNRGLRFYVRICHRGEIKQLGVYSDFGEAFSVFHSAYVELHGEMYEDASKIISQEILDNDNIDAFIYHYQ
jgi:hypothetical protein